jgi:hypothetical protein
MATIDSVTANKNFFMISSCYIIFFLENFKKSSAFSRSSAQGLRLTSKINPKLRLLPELGGILGFATDEQENKEEFSEDQ